MTKRPSEQRAEPRCSGMTERICWTRDSAAPTAAATNHPPGDAGLLHSGWVSNSSPAGVAFLTARRDVPAPGERIELVFGAGGRTPRHTVARVLRTQPFDRYFALVACQHAGLA